MSQAEVDPPLRIDVAAIDGQGQIEAQQADGAVHAHAGAEADQEVAKATYPQ